ncbi:MAG: CapA family protein [Acetatifactor sp.]|nr:CapA family protein [Acetatifactor sp.]
MQTKNTTSLVFTGDIGFDRYMDGKWEDTELLSKEVLAFLHSGDHVIANVEGPLVAQPTNQTKEGVAQLLHTMNPKATKVLRNMKADIWNICNNHIMDAGPEGIQATLQEAKEFGAITLGAGRNLAEAAKPVILQEAGGIGMIGVGYQRGCKPAGEEKAGCLNWSDYETIQAAIDEVKKTCKWCIIVSHGGEEFTSLPSPYTRDRYLRYLEMGADVIVCHHPHVPMNYEYVGDKAIFYSLGNFIFDTDYQRAQYNTEKGVVLKLKFTEERFDFEALGILIDRETEHIVKSELPKIFTEVDGTQYELLAPLAAKMFIAATKRQQIYLNAKEYANASDEKWAEHFANPMRSGRVPGEGLDFFIICPLAEKESEKAWMRSDLEEVKAYILEQM